MSDLVGVNDTLPVRLGGVNTSSGLPDNYADVNSSGQLLVKDAADGPVTPGTVAVNSNLAAGQYNTTLPSPTNTQQSALQQDYRSRLLTAPYSYSYFHPLYSLRAQTQANSNSSNSTTLATTIKATQVGSLIVVSATSATGALTCTDSASQTYTTAVTNTSGTHTHYIFYKANSAAGVTSVTITDGSSTSLNMIVSEYTNILSSPLDKTQTNTAGPTTAFTSNATSTTTQANELLIGSAFDIAKNTTTFIPGSGWNSVNSIQNAVGAAGGSLFQEDQYVTATGAYTATGTMSQSDVWIANIATFEISSYPTNFVTPNSPVVVKSGQGTLSNVVINTLGTGGASVTFYDNTTNSGNIIATLSLTTSIGSIPYNLHFTNGLTMVVNSITPDFTVIYD